MAIDVGLGRVHAARYDPDSGRILSVVTTTADGLESMSALLGHAFTPADLHVSDATHYVFNGALLLRPACPATLAGVTLSNVPTPSVITVNGVDYECEDDTVELEFDQPGTYAVIVHAFPYLEGEFEVTA